MTDSIESAPKFRRKAPAYEGPHRARKFILPQYVAPLEDLAVAGKRGNFKKMANYDSGRADRLLRDFSK